MVRSTDAVILDVDGTLWDSTGIVAGAWTRAVRENGFPDMTITGDQLRPQFGRTMNLIAEDLLPQLTDEQRLSIINSCRIYEQLALEANECSICYPDVPGTIRELSRVMPVFIVSNCQAGYIELFMKKNGLESYITDFECYGNTGKGKKENLRLLIERNHLKNPIYVGDTEDDFNAAREAGAGFVYASYGFGETDCFDAEISAFSELTDIITMQTRR